MFREFLEFLLSLWREWKALLTGGTIIAVLMLWQMASGKPVPSVFNWLVLGVTLLIAAFFSWIKVRTQLREANARVKSLESQFYMQCSVGDIQVQRVDESEGEDGEYHIFIYPTIALTCPDRVHIGKYMLELRFLGIPHYPAEHLDITHWLMNVAHPSNQGATLDIVPLLPLTREIQAGRPSEGWLHFITDAMLERQLSQCNLRLFIETDRGTCGADIRQHLTPNPQRRTFSRQ